MCHRKKFAFGRSSPPKSVARQLRVACYIFISDSDQVLFNSLAIRRVTMVQSEMKIMQKPEKNVTDVLIEI